MTELYSKAKLPTRFGEFDIYIFREGALEHAALVKPWDDEAVTVRIQSKCVTGEVFGSLKCDCGDQLEISLDVIGTRGGILIYLDQEGRGIGLGNKIKAYELQQQGFDTVDANLMLGFSEDERDFSAAVGILQQFDISSVKLLTNNPDKIRALLKAGIKVEKVPIKGEVNSHNRDYLLAKQKRMGHELDLDLIGLKTNHRENIRRIKRDNRVNIVRPARLGTRRGA